MTMLPCASSGDVDQPGHPPRLICTVFSLSAPSVEKDNCNCFVHADSED